ncbi:MAG TPA: right-handed parallel beta-helix repeat-containing protein, partial [Acidimicrobiia bacterium]
RLAITQANAAPGPDTIDFDVPGAPEILLTSALPPLTSPVTIDGTSQADVVVRTVAPAPSFPGLSIVTPDVTVAGLALGGFSAAIATRAPWTSIVGNDLGVRPDGVTPIPNDVGLALDSGAGAVVTGNVVSANLGAGIRFSGGGTAVITGNRIGSTADGLSDLGNGAVGIGLATVSGPVVIGGTGVGDRNVISGNAGPGIAATGVGGLTVLGNHIGTGLDGVTPLGNDGDGVRLSSLTGALVGGDSDAEGNTIAFNGGAGVAVDDLSGASVHNSIRHNRIHDNVGLGIDLAADGPTPNDPGDGDTGPNALQNFPVIESAATIGGVTLVEGFLSSTDDTTIQIDLYANSQCDASGVGEGELWVSEAATLVQTFFAGPPSTDDGTFVAGFVSPFPPPFFVTATATAPESAADLHGSTSEFSACVQPEVEISHRTLDFGSHVVATSDTQFVTITNTGPDELSGISVTVLGIDAADFVVPPGTCASVTLAPFESCFVPVAFSPSAPG